MRSSNHKLCSKLSWAFPYPLLDMDMYSMLRCLVLTAVVRLLVWSMEASIEHSMASSIDCSSHRVSVSSHRVKAFSQE
jgi:hypothetical protein